uniref:Uncharacterized protein n=1 Tax=Oryza brachyantha TaxID=4533 RepID=J3KWX6_ORYBR
MEMRWQQWRRAAPSVSGAPAGALWRSRRLSGLRADRKAPGKPHASLLCHAHPIHVTIHRHACGRIKKRWAFIHSWELMIFHWEGGATAA